MGKKSCEISNTIFQNYDFVHWPFQNQAIHFTFYTEIILSQTAYQPINWVADRLFTGSLNLWITYEVKWNEMIMNNKYGMIWK
jgi:hypothetical protein